MVETAVAGIVSDPDPKEITITEPEAVGTLDSTPDGTSEIEGGGEVTLETIDPPLVDAPDTGVVERLEPETDGAVAPLAGIDPEGAAEAVFPEAEPPLLGIRVPVEVGPTKG